MRATLFTICTWLLIASGSFLGVSGGLDYWDSRHGQTEIAQEWQQEATNSVTPADSDSTPKTFSPKSYVPPPVTGSAVAKLLIPRLNTVLYVVEGTGDHDLKRGPGHLVGSVMPGQDGNCVIAGHRDTHFRVLKNIRSGDEVILERGNQRFRYRVDGIKVVTPDNISSLLPTDNAVLNLVTCYPFQYVGSAPKRFIVHADLENSSLEASR